LRSGKNTAILQLMSPTQRCLLKFFSFIPSVRERYEAMLDDDYYIQGGHLKQRLAELLNKPELAEPSEEPKKPVSEKQVVIQLAPNSDGDSFFSSDEERNRFFTFTH
jgi:hypothetical protein